MYMNDTTRMQENIQTDRTRTTITHATDTISTIANVEVLQGLGYAETKDGVRETRN